MNTENQPTAIVHHATAPGSDIELGCIDLIAKLEASVAAARESSVGAHVEHSAENCDKLLNSLLDFSEDYLPAVAAEEVKSEILLAAYAKSAHKEFLDSRSWSSAFKGIFAGTEGDEDAKATHQQLKKTLMNACAIALQKAVAVVGPDSDAGKMIDQSSEALISEFAQYW